MKKHKNTNQSVKALAAIIISALAFFVFGPKTTYAVVESVSWTSLVNATANGGTITSTSSTNSGGISTQTIPSGDGYVEFTVSTPNGNRAAGLSNGNTDTSLADIDFAIRLNGGTSAEIIEKGTYKTETTYTTNDIFRVELTSGQVKYKKNGSIFYTSAQTPTYPLLADTFFNTSGTAITNATISYGGGGADTTAPTISITSPSAGATISGTTTVTVNASDNVGVVGVQFKLDGNNIGIEDTSAPYSYSWDSTQATNSNHTWTASARDAAGNTTISSGVTVTVNNAGSPPPPPPPGPTPTPTPTPTPSPTPTPPGAILFQSNWDAATGTSDTALRDGGKWSWSADFGGGQLLSVVPSSQAPGGPATTNVLKVLQKGSTYAANVQVNDFVPATTDYYLRYYMRNDDTSSAGDHIVTVDTYSYDNLTFMRKVGGSSNYKMYVSVYGCGYVYPIGYWSPATNLNNNTWYRFEYFIHYVDGTHIQVHPRVYDMTGNLILSDVNFLQSDPGAQVWNGSSNWNLSSYYAAGYNFCVNPNGRADAGGHTMQNFGLGNNGQQGAANTGLPWYFAGIQMRTDTWPGAIGGSPTPSPTPTPAPVPPPPPPPGAISASYPGDVGIENNPNVVFVEKFNESNLSGLTSRYNDVLNSASMSLTSDVPAGSGDNQSLTIAGGNGGHLFKQIPGINDTIYVRYYAKYPTSGLIQHSGVWAGGYNPALTFPNPQAGVKPVGNDRFSAAAEQEDAAFAGTTRLDHYDYWMGMHPDNSGTYWGNTLLNNTNIQATKGQWVCVEQMIKLNNPVSASNGEHAIWLNGTKVSDLGQGFPTGTWSGGNFVQGSGTAFPGFQWRNDANLNINYLWLQNYAPQAPYGTVKYDNLVAATSYIGCMTSSSAQPLTGDINSDHIVNSIDYSILNSHWFSNDATSDLNHDGIVNAIDFSMLNSNWFKTW